MTKKKSAEEQPKELRELYCKRDICKANQKLLHAQRKAVMAKEMQLITKYPELEQKIMDCYSHAHKEAENLIKKYAKDATQYEAEIKTFEKE